MSLRDEIWNAVLVELVETGHFKRGDLPFAESQRHTVRRVLGKMEDQYWLNRENERDDIYRLGENAKIHLDVSQETIRRSEEI